MTQREAGNLKTGRDVALRRSERRPLANVMAASQLLAHAVAEADQPIPCSEVCTVDIMRSRGYVASPS